MPKLSGNFYLEDRLKGKTTVDMALLSVAGTEGLWVGRPRNRGSFTARTKDFSLLLKHPDQLRCPTSTLRSVQVEAVFPRGEETRA